MGYVDELILNFMLAAAFLLSMPFCINTRAQNFLSRVLANSRAGPDAAIARRFVVGGEALGRVLPKAAEVLSRFPETFAVNEESVTLLDAPYVVTSSPGCTNDELVDSRSSAVDVVLQALRSDGSVPMLQGWRNESFAVRPSFYAPPRLVIERAAGPLFGLPAYGCFTNGFISSTDGRPTHLWLGKRADDKPTWPGLLDCIAAGGIAAGTNPSAAMVQECAEEAGIPHNIAERLISVGGVSYTGFNQDEWGIKPDFLFIYDLRLDASFVPICTDGEMAEFRLYSIEEVPLHSHDV